MKQLEPEKALLLRPDLPLYGQEPFLTLHDYPLKNRPELFEQMAHIAKKTFLVLEKAWQCAGGKLVDFKVEFGFDNDGQLLLADVIDNDSWRVVQNGAYIDKQFYREGGDLNEVTRRYERVCDLTHQFNIPKQRIIIWRGSVRDNIDAFMESFAPYRTKNLDIICVTQSMHKNPIKGYIYLQKLIQEVPNSVLIAFVGRSNAAGPMLSAHATVPVITVPAGWEKRPEDIWSSLRTPSDVPVVTALYEKNALLMGLQILAMRNPSLYADLRLKQEGRLVNIIEM